MFKIIALLAVIFNTNTSYSASTKQPKLPADVFKEIVKIQRQALPAASAKELKSDFNSLEEKAFKQFLKKTLVSDILKSYLITFMKERDIDKKELSFKNIYPNALRTVQKGITKKTKLDAIKKGYVGPLFFNVIILTLKGKDS